MATKNVFILAFEGDLEGVKKFLTDYYSAHHENGLNVRESDGGTILLAAVLGLNYDIVKYLLEQGAKCDDFNEWGVTPLH